MTNDDQRARTVGAWCVRPALNRIERDGRSVALQPQAMDILVYLADHAGEIVSSEALLAAFWSNRLAGDDAVHRRIAYLRKHLEDDARDPRYIQTVSKRGYRLVAAVAAMPATAAAPVDAIEQAALAEPPRRGLWRAVAAALAVLVGGYVAVQFYRSDLQFERALARAAVLVEQDDAQGALVALGSWAGEADDPRVAALLQRIILAATIRTDPPGIAVRYRPQGRDDLPWVDLGSTPVVGRALPRGVYELDLGGRVNLLASHPGVTLNSAGVPERIIEMPRDAIPPDMVFVPGGRYRLGAWGFMEALDLGGFLLDRDEVTNRDYLEFVEAGGYQDRVLWEPLIERSAGRLSWAIIREQFVDHSGRPGPAGWELGAYPTGSGALPVTGVTWYEAAAYLAYRDKVLPSAHHWLRATLGPMEWRYPQAAVLVPRSNLGGDALEAVGQRPAASVHGAHDLIGNAREWTAGHHGELRIVMGGSFREPAWSYNFPSGVDPLSRRDDLGFRGMRATAQSVPLDDTQIDLFDDFDAPIRRVSDEVFEGMTYQYAYSAGQIRAADARVLDETQSEFWITRRIELPTGRDDDPLPVYLFLPRKHERPLQSLVFLPPADSWSPGFSSAAIRLESYQLDFVPRSGRALIWPVVSGTHERYDGFHAVSGPERAKLAIERNRRLRDEIGRLVDYLEDDPEFDGARIGLAGLSFGSTVAAYPLALEPRIKAAVLYSAGIATLNPVFANPQNDPNLFWARVRQPVLILNGRYDPIRPHQRILDRLLELLATPREDKQAVLLESAHWPLPRYQMMEHTLGWLDRYLGPVAAAE